MGFLHLFARSQIFFPTRYPDGDWSARSSLQARDVWLQARDGVRVHGWWVPGLNATVVTVFLHGNGGNLTYRARHLQEIAAAGSDVLIIDYRGYGRSEGSPSEEGVYADADAAYDYCARSGKPVVIHGESLGSAVAVDLAVRRLAAGVILEAPFTSVRAMAGTVLPLLGPLVISGFDSLSKAPRLRSPLLVLHGGRDAVVPVRFGRELYEAATCPKSLWILGGAGHNDLVAAAGTLYGTRLREFYARIIS